MSLGEKTAVILLNFGGPVSLAEVKMFLRRIFSDPNILPVRPGFVRKALASVIARRALKKSIRKYKAIGGASPLVDITQRQADALQKELKYRGQPMRVYPAMRYSQPEIEETILNALFEHPEEFIIFPLYPHYSITTTGSAFAIAQPFLKELIQPTPQVGPFGKVRYVESYESHPGYVQALAGKLRASLDEAKKSGEKAQVMFSAHSLPRRLWIKDSLYISHIKTTARLVAEAAGVENYELAFQSGRPRRGFFGSGCATWLGPTVEEMLGRLAGGGCKSVVVMPLSFTCDNIETLYDIDIKLKEEADKLSVTLRRTESLNDSPAFIAALADIVLDRLKG